MVGHPQYELLEQRHPHLSARVETFDFCRNLDVAVGVRQAGDIAGGLVCGFGDAIHETHRIELMPSASRFHPASEWRIDRSWGPRWQSRHTTQEREYQDVSVRQAG